MSRASQSAARARQREDQKAGKRGTHPAEGAVARNRARRSAQQSLGKNKPQPKQKKSAAKPQGPKGRPAGPASIEILTVYSNKDPKKSVSLATGISALEFSESILSDTLSASVLFADSGDSTDNKGAKPKDVSTAISGLPIVGEEKVELKFTDNIENTLELTMYVNKVEEFGDDTTKSAGGLQLVSKEYLRNEKVRLNICMVGKISQHVEKILTGENFLATEKECFIDETGAKNYNFHGNKWKSFYAINNLATKAVPNNKDGPGNSAGFIFWETSQGFHFKSLDSLMGQKEKKSIIYNDTADTDIPPGYDIKAVKYKRNSAINVQDKSRMGAYKTQLISFNFFDKKYTETILSAGTTGEKGKPGDQEFLTMAGNNLPVFNKELNTGLDDEFTRKTWQILDTGSLPGGTTESQINKSKEVNFDTSQIFNQSIMRLNQLFAQTVSVTIPGDFSLHAGDSVFIDAPGLTGDPKSDEVNKESGGMYIISDLTHRVTGSDTFTRLECVRDSVGRKGGPARKKVKEDKADKPFDSLVPGNNPAWESISGYAPT